jgi:hypothetical protein
MAAAPSLIDRKRGPSPTVRARVAIEAIVIAGLASSLGACR